MQTMMSGVTAECMMGFAEMRECGLVVRITGIKEDEPERGVAT